MEWMIKGKYVAVTVGDAFFNVTQYGARGDGTTDDSAAIQKALDAAQGAGGGVVVIPAGRTFLIKGISINGDHTELNIEGTLLISNDYKSWPSNLKAAITIPANSNVAITGRGTIDGQGAVWWANLRNSFRPTTLYPHNTDTLIVTGITVKDCPYHCLEMYSSNTEIFGITLRAPPSTGIANPSHNTDGIDVHGDNFFLHDSDISVGDDNVAIHSSKVLVEDCLFGNGHGASIGSLCTEQISDIVVQRVNFSGTTCGPRIKTVQGCGGSLSNVHFQDLVLNSVQETLEVNMFYTQSSAKPSGGTFKVSNVNFVNIRSTNPQTAGSFLCDAKSPCGIYMNGVVQSGKKLSYQCSHALGCRHLEGPAMVLSFTDISYSDGTKLMCIATSAQWRHSHSMALADMRKRADRLRLALCRHTDENKLVLMAGVGGTMLMSAPFGVSSRIRRHHRKAEAAVPYDRPVSTAPASSLASRERPQSFLDFVRIPRDVPSLESLLFKSVPPALRLPLVVEVTVSMWLTPVESTARHLASLSEAKVLGRIRSSFRILPVVVVMVYCDKSAALQGSEYHEAKLVLMTDVGGAVIMSTPFSVSSRIRRHRRATGGVPYDRPSFLEFVQIPPKVPSLESLLFKSVPSPLSLPMTVEVHMSVSLMPTQTTECFLEQGCQATSFLEFARIPQDVPSLESLMFRSVPSPLRLPLVVEVHVSLSLHSVEETMWHLMTTNQDKVTLSWW
eukprot:m51a1_g9008 putative polygalacturonase at1g48100-like (729) ;mRNA; r:135515-141804